jgi:microcystin-dependent protein
MFGIPTFDLLSDRGKQEFIEYVVNLTRKEINSYTPSYNNVSASTMLTDASLPTAGTAGTYTKVTTDVYGRVASGTTLVAADIPTLTLAKISDAGTAAAKNIPATGNASATQVVYGSDTRLTTASANQVVYKNASNVASGDATFTFDGSNVYVPLLKVNTASGDEGGQIDLIKAVTNTTLSSGVTIDVYRDKLRIYETGSPFKGVYIDIGTSAASAADELATTGDITTHTADTTSVHGISNTANLVATTDTGTVTSTMILNGTILNADVNASAAIDKTKISGTAVTIADTGTVTSTMILNDTILDADINASAAIAPTKISGTAIVANDTSYLNPTGSMLAYAGINTPTGWLLCDGASVSRTTYATLFAALSTSFATATTTNTSTTVSGLTSMATATHVGWGIAGNGIPTGATISSVANATTVVISAAATVTATGTASLVISPYKFTGANNTTTFLVPDLRGRVVAGKDDMGGTAASRVTFGVSGIIGTILGGVGGSEALHTHTHTQNSHNHTQDPHTHQIYYSVQAAAGSNQSNPGTATGTYGGATSTTATNQATTAVNQNAGTGSSQNIQPTIITNYIIKT